MGYLWSNAGFKKRPSMTSMLNVGHGSYSELLESIMCPPRSLWMHPKTSTIPQTNNPSTHVRTYVLVAAAQKHT